MRMTFANSVPFLIFLRKKFSTIFLITALIGGSLLTGCGSEEKPNDKPSSIKVYKNLSKVVSPRGTQRVTLGDSLSIDIKTSSDTVSIDSIVFAFGDSFRAVSTTGSINIPGNQINSTGVTRIIAKVYLSNQKTETLYPKFSILPPPAKNLTFKIVKEYPHDITSYTQGLLLKDGIMYEGTGQEGESKLMAIDYPTGKVLQSLDLDDSFFGEGVTIIEDRIYQLTWKGRVAFLYDLNFNKINTFRYNTEGWGLTTYGDTLLMSDGTHQIYFRNKDSFEEFKKIGVHDHVGIVDSLNELEMINGRLFANVYPGDQIVVINPVNGAVEAKLDLSSLFPERRNQNRAVDALNGIAYDKKKDRYFVTGKWWPKLYELEIK